MTPSRWAALIGLALIYCGATLLFNRHPAPAIEGYAIGVGIWILCCDIHAAQKDRKRGQ